MENSKCVGCGYCCQTPCLRACTENWIDEYDQCIKLYWNEELKMYRCIEVESSSTFARYVFIGGGCGLNLNSWRKDVKRR